MYFYFWRQFLNFKFCDELYIVFVDENCGPSQV